MYLLVLEFLGTNELLVILVVALILLGPRRLPQMSRKLGKSLADFKRASEDFKRTWEREVEMDLADKDARIERAMLPADNLVSDATVGRDVASNINSISEQPENLDEGNLTDFVPAPLVTPVEPATTTHAATAAPLDETAETVPTRKRDWL